MTPRVVRAWRRRRAKGRRASRLRPNLKAPAGRLRQGEA
jgi:hypothetical protein